MTFDGVKEAPLMASESHGRPLMAFDGRWLPQMQVQLALKEAHLRPELRDAMPVALRLLRGMDPEGDATLNENEFVRGFRFLIEAASKLDPPLLTSMPVERRKLKSLFQTSGDCMLIASLSVCPWSEGSLRASECSRWLLMASLSATQCLLTDGS